MMNQAIGTIPRFQALPVIEFFTPLAVVNILNVKSMNDSAGSTNLANLPLLLAALMEGQAPAICAYLAVIKMLHQNGVIPLHDLDQSAVL